MRLTAMTDYAMRLLIHVAQHPDRLCTIVEVAAAYGISEAHLMKVTHQLALHGWIETVRGKGGGMRLARAPAEIGIGDVVRSIESDFRMAECFGEHNSCMLTGSCRLATLLDGALQSFLAHLDAHSLADLLPMPGGAAPAAAAPAAGRPLARLKRGACAAPARRAP